MNSEVKFHTLIPSHPLAHCIFGVFSDTCESIFHSPFYDWPPHLCDRAHLLLPFQGNQSCNAPSLSCISLSLFFFPVVIRLTIKSLYYSTHLQKKTKSLSLPHYFTVHVCMLSHFSHIQFFATLWTVARQAPLSLRLPGKNTGMGCHALLQETFLTRGLNSCLLYLLLCTWILCNWATKETPLFYYYFNYKTSQKCSH